MLNDMLQEGRQAKHDEEVQYSSYAQFCTDTEAEKAQAISDAEQAITTLEADIQLATATAQDLDTQAAQHQSDIIALNAEQQNATQDRTVQKVDYERLHADYTESIIALERAIQTLRAQDYSREQATAMLAQLSALQKSRLVPAGAKKTLALFLARSSENPEAYAYEFQSGHIIDLLEDLLTKFKDERTNLETEEANAKHSYNLLMMDLNAQVDQNTKELQSKTASKAAHVQSKAENENVLADTVAVKEADEAYLSDLNATCTAKAASFSERQQLRTDEIQALERAVTIMSADNVTGHAAKHLPSMLQVSRKSLAMLRGSGSHTGNEEKTHEFLVEQAQKLNSRALSALAAQVKDDDPFAKVRQMIQDLITRLQEEAGTEASHKEYCDEELAKNEKTRTEKTQEVEVLHAEIDKLNATIAQLTMEISELEKQVVAIDSAAANATEFRREESATNNETVKDAKEGQAAVGEAITLLKDFYAQAATATSLVQQDPPKIFDEPYQGMQDSSTGVIGILEVVQSDFARLESETVAAEAEAQAAHTKFVHDSEVDKTANNKDIEYKTTQKQEDEQALSTAETDLESTQRELDAALEFYETLKPTCIDTGITYEERVQRREEEIASLQEALRILEGGTI